MSLVKSLARGLIWPIRRLLDPRFADVTRRLTDTRQAVHDEATATRVAVGSLTENVDKVVGTYAATSTESLTFVGGQLRDLERSVEGATEVIERSLDGLVAAEQGRIYVERLNRLSRDGKVADLDGAAAELLNYAVSHRGFAAQVELWANPPFTIEHGEGRVALGQVNERIVEVPFALRGLGAVPVGGRVLDFGASESTLSLSLATMGFQVTALDLREYPFEHPNLSSVACALEEWDAPAGSFEAVLCVSTVEHVGLGWYGEEPGQEGADRRAMERLRELLVPGGTCVLTVPYGTWSVDAVQRRYDAAHLDALIEGWTVVERSVVERRDDRTWVPVEASDSHSVAMLVLQSPQPA